MFTNFKATSSTPATEQIPVRPSQDIRHAGTAENTARWNATRPFPSTSDRGTSTRHGWAKRATAIAALGLAGALGVTACSQNPHPKAAPTHRVAPAANQSPEPSTPTAQPTVPAEPGTSQRRSPGLSTPTVRPTVPADPGTSQDRGPGMRTAPIS